MRSEINEDRPGDLALSAPASHADGDVAGGDAGQSLLDVNDVSHFRHMLADLRTEVGIDQAELGRRIGKSRSVVSDLESGVARLDVATLSRICRALGVSLFRLVWEARRNQFRGDPALRTLAPEMDEMVTKLEAIEKKKFGSG